jgi:arylsulfatase A-like enzyme
MKLETLNRRRFLQTGTLAATSLSVFTRTPSAAERKPPNIILILTDDQRWDTLGCMGNRIIQTPNLDHIAQTGMICANNFCTTSICMTSRASILTGQYSRTHQINRFDQPLSAEQFACTYPAVLRRSGYYTGFIGKWGLGGEIPEKQFDYFEGFGGQGQYFQEIDGKQVHLTQIIEDQTREFLNQRSVEQPFCLSISTKAPHVQDGHPDPFRYDPRYKDLYADDFIPPPHSATPIHYDRQPEFIRNSEGRTRWEQRFSTEEQRLHSVRNYYRLITGVDRLVGTVLQTLEEKNLYDNTVIIYTSDNGFFLGEHGMAGKWLMYEESIRTPLIIHDPRVKETEKGQRRENITLNIDIAPTVLALAGVEPPTQMQGLPLFQKDKGWTEPRSRKDFFYEHPYNHNGKIPQSEGIRTHRWKYIHYPEYGHKYDQLFDLRYDRYEEFNLAGLEKYKETMDTLIQRRKEWVNALEQGKQADDLFTP